MDSADFPTDFPLWETPQAWPPLYYGLLLKLAIYCELYNQRTKDNQGTKDLICFKPKIDNKLPQFLTYQFEFLFDLYWNDLPLLDNMITKLTIPLPDHQIYTTSRQRESKSLESIKNFLYPLGPGPNDALGLDRVYLSKLNCDMSEVLKIKADQLDESTRALREFTPSYEYTLPLIQNPGESLSLSSPYADSFRRWSSHSSNLKERFTSCEQKTTEYIRSFLDKEKGRPLESCCSEAINEIDLAIEIDKITTKSPATSSIVLFAVSGSGKTRSIERLLSCHFGFYFQACYVPLQTQGLHSAQRISGSRDTLTLGNMIRYAQEIIQQPGVIDEILLVQRWLSKLIGHRRSIFAIFLDVAQKLCFTPELLPRLWYELQVSDSYDIFDNAFQLLCLDNVNFPSDQIHDSTKEMLRGKELYYCLDEAQSDIDTQIRTSDGTISLLRLWAQALSTETHGPGAFRFAAIPPLVYSGTSLRTTDAVNAVKYGGLTYKPWFGRQKECCVFSSFPVVRDDEQFKTAMSKHGLGDLVQNEDEDMKARLNLIIQHAKPLYGRPGWSVLYLKRVKEILRQDSTEGSTNEEIEKASNKTVNEVKRNLKDRVQALHLKGETRVMEDICRVVVWSDLTDRPTHFWGETGPKMIEQAFAVMKKCSNGEPSNRNPSAGNASRNNLPDREALERSSEETSLYMLEERLALDAAKEYILTAGSDLVERYLAQYLQEHANTTGSFGKPAEYFLAWSLDRAFIDDGEHLCGSSEKDRLTKLLEALSSNQMLLKLEQSRDTAARSSVQLDSLNLSGYTLVRGIKTGHAFDNTVPLVDWMSAVRRSIKKPEIRPNATFYFPEEQVGPDLMFALHKKPPEGRDEVVLCVLQLKCGAAELEKGIKRTDLSKAYISKTGVPNKIYLEQIQALEKELEAWSAPDPAPAPEFRILRVLVTAAVRPARGEVERVVARGTSCVEYFIRCDATQTELLFGSGFKVLLDSLRSEDKSLSAIYAKVNYRSENTVQLTTRI